MSKLFCSLQSSLEQLTVSSTLSVGNTHIHICQPNVKVGGLAPSLQQVWLRHDARTWYGHKAQHALLQGNQEAT